MIKHPKEWDEYITEVCKIYGFKKKLNPTGFTKEGRYIGGYEDILEELHMRFDADDFEVDQADLVHPEVGATYLKLNNRIAEDDYKHRNRMTSLADRIEEEYISHLKRGNYNFHVEKFETIDLGDRIVPLLHR